MKPDKSSTHHKEATPFDVSTIREPRRYVWREIPREDGDPLRVKLLRLTMREVQPLTFEPKTPMSEIHAAIAPYVVEWNFNAENLETGELVEVPAPAVIGGEVFEIFEGPIGSTILLWLKAPQFMLRNQDEDSAKNASSSSGPTEPQFNEIGSV